MKRLTILVLFGLACAAAGTRVEGATPPRAVSLVEKQSSFHLTHYVRQTRAKPMARSAVESTRPFHLTHYVRQGGR